VPAAAARSLGVAAAWTGAATALLGAVIGIVAVAVCWLPASGPSGNAGSAVRAGILTFLAALHGGITVDGVRAAFVPLGLTVVVGLLAWRAGTGLADAAADLGEHPRRALVRAGAIQAGVFAVVCALLARLSPLGTSNVSEVAAFGAGLVLFAGTGSVAFARHTSLAAVFVARRPSWLAPSLRAALAGVIVYVGVGALLVACSVLLHRGRVELLSGQVGGGWSGLPVLLLGVLAAPNAAVAGASYLAGPGFAVGSGSSVSLGSTVHGTLPAFPVLGAVPTGPANAATWLLAAVTPVLAGVAVVRVVGRSPSWRSRWQQLGLAVPGIVLLALPLAWLGGGGIGDGRLSAVGASPWQFALATAAGTGAVAVPALAALAAVGWWRAHGQDRADTRAGQPGSVPVDRPALIAVSGSDTAAPTVAAPRDHHPGTEGPAARTRLVAASEPARAGDDAPGSATGQRAG
jgi:hypothetical protein